MATITVSDTRIKATATMHDSADGTYKEVQPAWIIEVKLGKKWGVPFRWNGITFHEKEWQAHKALDEFREHIAAEGGSIEIG